MYTVELVTSGQPFFPMIYYRTDGNVGGVGDADNGRPFTAALTNVNVLETDGPTPWPRRCFSPEVDLMILCFALALPNFAVCSLS